MSLSVIAKSAGLGSLQMDVFLIRRMNSNSVLHSAPGFYCTLCLGNYLHLKCSIEMFNLRKCFRSDDFIQDAWASRVGGSETPNDVLACIDGGILCCVPTVRQTRDLCRKIRVAEERNRASGGHGPLSAAYHLCRRGHDSVQRGTQNIVAPTSKKITHVHYDGAPLERN